MSIGPMHTVNNVCLHIDTLLDFPLYSSGYRDVEETLLYNVYFIVALMTDDEKWIA